MKSKGSAILAVLVVVAWMGSSVSDAAEPPIKSKDAPKTDAVRATVPEGVGTVQYDPGAPADTVLTGPGNGYPYPNYFGNTFDTRNGAPLSPGSITGVSWYQGPVTGGAFARVAFGSPGATLSDFYVSGVAPYAFNAVSAAIPVATGAQFVGLGLYDGDFGSIGMRSASTNGQGFHGHQRDFFGGGYVVLSGQNAMLRVSGSVIVPVELMEFELE